MEDNNLKDLVERVRERKEMRNEMYDDVEVAKVLSETHLLVDPK